MLSAVRRCAWPSMERQDRADGRTGPWRGAAHLFAEAVLEELLVLALEQAEALRHQAVVPAQMPVTAAPQVHSTDADCTAGCGHCLK